MTNAYDRVAGGETFWWPLLSEEERYGIWSLSCERGGSWDYSEFCDTMDLATENSRGKINWSNDED